MPSKLPRVNVAVSVEQHELLMELGRLQHRSASSYLRELLDAATPALALILPVLRAREAAVGEMPQKLEQAALEAFTGLLGVDPAQIDLEDLLASLVVPQASDAGSASGSHAEGGEAVCECPERAASPPSDASQPPSCNYGGQLC